MTNREKEIIEKNLKSFTKNFGDVKIEKDSVTKGFFIYYPANAESHIHYCENIYHLDGWLWGVVQGRNRREFTGNCFLVIYRKGEHKICFKNVIAESIEVSEFKQFKGRIISFNYIVHGIYGTEKLRNHYLMELEDSFDIFGIHMKEHLEEVGAYIV